MRGVPAPRLIEITAPDSVQPNLDAPKKAAAADPMAVWAERLIEEGSVESFMEELGVLWTLNQSLAFCTPKTMHSLNK